MVCSVVCSVACEVSSLLIELSLLGFLASHPIHEKRRIIVAKIIKNFIVFIFRHLRIILYLINEFIIAQNENLCNTFIARSDYDARKMRTYAPKEKGEFRARHEYSHALRIARADPWENLSRPARLPRRKRRANVTNSAPEEKGEFRARHEYSHALRLASELSDLRAANANSRTCVAYASSLARRGTNNKRTLF